MVLELLKIYRVRSRVGHSVYFSTLCHKRHDIWKKAIDHKIGVFICLIRLPETFLILIRIERDVTENVYC